MLLKPLLFLALAASQAFAQDLVTFRGMCDASAATAIDGNHFLVADDEDNILRLFKRQGGDPVAQFDLHQFIGATKNPTRPTSKARRNLAI